MIFVFIFIIIIFEIAFFPYILYSAIIFEVTRLKEIIQQSIKEIESGGLYQSNHRHAPIMRNMMIFIYILISIMFEIAFFPYIFPYCAIIMSARPIKVGDIIRDIIFLLFFFLSSFFLLASFNFFSWQLSVHTGGIL